MVSRRTSSTTLRPAMCSFGAGGVIAVISSNAYGRLPTLLWMLTLCQSALLDFVQKLTLNSPGLRDSVC